ncbi:MAG: SDR family oxidoreductase [Aquincola sp.]|nr:SDR family oxidoreductase [Aquincola sp.]|tara:strand:+ start:10245 stop:11027 length:783 start_codon:yes stop_codon:yes gene_type:complete
MGRFEGKVVLVTGAGRGVGKAVSLAFAAEGARVVVCARTESYGQAVVEGIRAHGGQALLIGGDVGRREDVRAMVQAALDGFGALDVVVHCAADVAQGRIAQMDEVAFDRQVHSNIHALFWLAKDSLPALSKSAGKGRLIYISSAAGNKTFTPGLVGYGSSKAYMNAFARGLAQEAGPMNVLVNVVELGLIASDRMREHLSDDLSGRIASSFPLRRVGRPDEIAAAVMFLASDDAGYITGSSLLVDGGASMSPIAEFKDGI